MKTLTAALLVAVSSLTAGAISAKADTFTVHGVWGGNSYDGR